MKCIKIILLGILIFTITLNVWTSNLKKDSEEISSESISKYVGFVFEIDDVFFKICLAINKSYIYIADLKESKIYIYSRDKHDLKRVFGHHGQGPSDFLNINFFDCTEDRLYVTDYRKLSIFDIEGNLVDEIKLRQFFFTLFPFKEKYLGMYHNFINHSKENRQITFSLYDKHVNQEKLLFIHDIHIPISKDNNKEIFQQFFPCRKGVVYNDRLYIGCTDLGFYIGVFDYEGNKLYEIYKKDIPPIKVDDEIKNYVLKFYKSVFEDYYTTFIKKKSFIFQNIYLPLSTSS